MSSELPVWGTAGAAPASPCKPWGFWASIAWGLLILGAWASTQVIAGFAAANWYGLGFRPTTQEIEQTISLAWFVSLATIAAAPVAILVMAIAVRLARCRFGEYLALTWPARREAVIGVVVLAVFIPLADLMSGLLGRDISPEFVTGMYRSARDAGVLLAFAFAVAVAAPLVEELVFRGFLLPGLAARIGAAGAIVLTSAAWSAMHMQYEFYYLLHIFALGLIFGWLRWRSGSTLLVIVLHALVNVFALAQAGYLVERMA